MRPRTDVTLTAIAGMVDAVLSALDLEGVILVGADTGGVVAQLVAVHHSQRLAALVLTSCDAFEHFPPPILKPLMLAAKTRATFRMALQPLRTAAARKRAYGALSHHDIDDLVVEWVKPALGNPAITDDLRRLTASLRQETTLDVAARLGEFTKPALIAWSADDVFFPIDDGKRLAAELPNAQLEIIDGARTFSMLDQPDRLAELVADIAGATTE
jgi:pimeloyl-ACP methyl ester carboxylesterase